MSGEIWKSVVDWPEYEVSNFGSVRRAVAISGSFVGKVLKQHFDQKGYLIVRLCREGSGKWKRVHILVALAFIGPCPEGHEVNHKDGVKTNCHHSNLEYLTPKKNIEHAYKTGLHKRLPGGERAIGAKLSNEQAALIRTRYSAGEKSRSLAKSFSVSQDTILRIVRNQSYVT